jgi:DMSO/TMAO reductase YedYZ molybdopterin-dependent catalytic subunit
VGGEGLDARQFTDLSRLAPDRLVTPAADVFIRTAQPPQLAERRGPWFIRLEGRPPAAAARLDVRTIVDEARPLGAHLIECAGNTDPENFGLMSVAEWDGVPLASLLPRFGTGPRGAALLVSGLDQTTPSWRSQPGASWVFPLDALERLGAFLAVRMNGAPLGADHGAPVRLVVPGWYGCAWIKWVDEVRLVGPDAAATPQMQEFAERTHQDGTPALARDYEPPAIDLAATPIRVEKRRVGGRLRYRVVGIVWGGDRPVDRLRIRFGARDPHTTFDVCPPHRAPATWSLWDYWWDPAEPGTYDIALAAVDPAIRTRRLDLSWYLRRVRVDEV